MLGCGMSQGGAASWPLSQLSLPPGKGEGAAGLEATGRWDRDVPCISRLLSLTEVVWTSQKQTVLDRCLPSSCALCLGTEQKASFTIFRFTLAGDSAN